jgi:AcrR family transcriptional regulator
MEDQSRAGSRRAAGQRTRETILSRAADIASVEGLEGLTIGRLAADLGISKSGLFAHFGSKEDLQLATVEAARKGYARAVFGPVGAGERGLARLQHLCESWLAYAGDGVFPGGCFFAAASAEFDGRPGPVRDRLASIMRDWLDALTAAAQQAIDDGEIASGTDTAQVAFELNAYGMAANWARQLLDDAGAFDRARTAMRNRIEALRPA